MTYFGSPSAKARIAAGRRDNGTHLGQARAAVRPAPIRPAQPDGALQDEVKFGGRAVS